MTESGTGKGKGEVQPRTSHEGPEGEQRYSSTLSLTSALDGGGWSTPRPRHFAGLDGCGKVVLKKGMCQLHENVA